MRSATASPTAPLRSARELARALGDAHVLVYFEARPDLWLVALGGGTVTVRSLGPADQAARVTDGLASRPDDAEAAAAAGRLLFPAGTLPAAGRLLHVVTDGAVERVPLAAVRVDGRVLAERHPVAVVPSVNALAALEAAARSDRARTAPAVLGDPRGDLPAARREAADVAARLRIEPRVGAEAGIEALRAARSARLLHVSSHVEMGASGPRLVLADGTAGLEDVLSWKLGPRIVVLASCLGGARGPRGAWGPLAAAFLAAGSESVVASLTSVPDEAARELVAAFYDRLDPAEPARSLAAAQAALAAAGRPASSWAPFMVFGTGTAGGPPDPATGRRGVPAERYTGRDASPKG
jgi:hypothetical protein